MLTLRLALRNLLGTGLRLWINVAVITVSIIVIIFSRALYEGLESQMLDSLIHTEVAWGQLRAEEFDPMDRLTFDNSPLPLPDRVKSLIEENKAVPVLYCNGTLYIDGRVMQIGFRGIRTEQNVLELPTENLDENPSNGTYSVMIGLRMMKLLKLEKGDCVTIKWRDRHGAFDAAEFRISQLIDKNNPRVDENVIWLDIEALREMFDYQQEESSMVVFGNREAFVNLGSVNGWQKYSRKKLVQWVINLIESDKAWANVIYGLLIFLCCVGIFNTQILEVFKRRKEIGTLMALGMRKRNIVALFTLEGVLMTLLAYLGVGIFGTPIFYWTTTAGIPLDHVEGMGMPVPEKLVPHYTFNVVFFALAAIGMITLLVSWFPSRRITELEPAQSLSGRK